MGVTQWYVKGCAGFSFQAWRVVFVALQSLGSHVEGLGDQIGFSGTVCLKS